MILDTSAVIAIVAREVDALHFRSRIVASSPVLISSASVLECCMVAHGLFGQTGLDAVWEVIESGEVEIIPVDERQIRHAIEGFVKFGKGNHPAKLNMGDCFVYGLAKERKMPILCKGSEFAKTDALIA